MSCSLKIVENGPKSGLVGTLTGNDAEPLVTLEFVSLAESKTISDKNNSNRFRNSILELDLPHAYQTTASKPAL